MGWPACPPQDAHTLDDRAAQLEADAAGTFARGQADNAQGDADVLATVFLAAVLLLIAVAERFRWAAVLGLALALLLFGLSHLAASPVV